LLLAGRAPSMPVVLGVGAWALLWLGMIEVEWELGNKAIVWTACLLGAGLILAGCVRCRSELAGGPSRYRRPLEHQ
jgi:hypothetical protein